MKVYKKEIIRLIKKFRPRNGPLRDYYSWKSLFKEKFRFGSNYRIDGNLIQEIVRELEDKSYRSFFGIPISVLINYSSERDIEIEIEKPLDYLGINKNRGRLIVKGDAGDHLGCYMRSGEIVAEGNAGEVAGAYMGGGRIVIKGSAGKEIGYMMRGGEIYVGKFEPENLSNHVYGGRIWKGLPGNSPELVLELGVLENSEDEIVLLFRKKMMKTKEIKI